jgi:hypothetical protein
MNSRLAHQLLAPLLVTFLAIVFFPGCPGDAENRSNDLPIPVPGVDENATGNLASDTTQGTTIRFVGDPVTEKIERRAAGDAPQTTPDVVAAAAGQSAAKDSSDGHSAERGHGKYSQKDPAHFEERNGRIFVGWEKPKLAIVFTGMLDGYIEPCGCAGLDNQLGGLSRRHTLIEQRRADGWPMVLLDLGGLVRRLGPQSTIKYQRAIDALKTMRYQAIGFGLRDLMLPTEELLVTLPQDGKSLFLCANVSSIFDEDYGLRAPYRIIEAGGFRLGVTSVLGSTYGKKLQNPDFTFVEPAKALPAVVQKLKAAKCDTLLLLANSTMDEAKQLTQQFTDFDYVAVASDSDPPADQPEPIKDTSTRLIDLGHKGMYLGVLAFFDNPQQPVRYQRVPLDGRFPDSKAMLAMMAAYQEQLKELGWAGLGLRPNPHPEGRKYVGSETCGECHTDAYDVWKETPHAHATETLVKLPTPRHHDPECISCHVVGWDPQGYFPVATGYVSLEKTPELRTVGCENCHGPGHDHVAAESGDVELEDDQIEALRAGMIQTYEDARKTGCLRCHDLDNSPDFDFDTYWPKVEHKGKN